MAGTAEWVDGASAEAAIKMSGSQANWCLIDMLEFSGFFVPEPGPFDLSNSLPAIETRQEYSF
jgi:hypothetical protein